MRCYTPWRQPGDPDVRRVATASIAALAVIALSACGVGTGSEGIPSPSSAISSQQSAALADGEVTWDEYETGFDAYRSCLAKAGYELVDPTRSGDVMDFRVPGGAVDSGADDHCYQYFWGQVDRAWQIAHEDTSETAKWIAACLQSKGVSPQPTKAENEELLRSHGIALSECAEDG